MNKLILAETQQGSKLLTNRKLSTADILMKTKKFKLMPKTNQKVGQFSMIWNDGLHSYLVK